MLRGYFLCVYLVVGLQHKLFEEVTLLYAVRLGEAVHHAVPRNAPVFGSPFLRQRQDLVELVDQLDFLFEVSLKLPKKSGLRLVERSM